jgi:hypothetical protein
MTTINQIPKSPRELEQFYRDIAKMLGSIAGIAWSLVNKAGSRLNEIVTRPHSDLQDITDWTGGAADRHISVENGVDWQAHVDVVDGNPHGTDHAMLEAIGELDPTSTNATKDKHLSNAQGKVWQDHVGITDGNPHGTDHDDLDNIAGTGDRHITVNENAEITALDGLAAGIMAKTGDAAYSARTITGTAGEIEVFNGNGGAGNPTIGLPETISTPRIFGDGTDNTTVESDGTLKFNGAATNWNDINKSLLPLSTGANVPSIIAVNGATYIKVRAFNGVGTLNELGEGCEVLHDYKEGTDIQPHLHWAPTTAAAGNVKWQLAYMWVERNGTYGSETVISVTTAAAGVAWQEQRVDFPAISGVGHTIGSRFQFVLFRNPADVADTYAADAAAFDFGLHYERDTIGSRQITAK